MNIIIQNVICLLFCSVFFATSVNANTIAIIDRNQLTDVNLNSDANFDLASQKEILTFAHLLDKSELLSVEDFALKLSLSQERINMQNIKHITDKFWQLLVANYQLATNQTMSLNDFRDLTRNFTPDSVRENFHQIYLFEQLRLAALFPNISSEIDLFSQNEIDGQHFKDKTFLFTFDDGPSEINGNTDKLKSILNQRHVSALFFVLGEKFSERQKNSSSTALNALYQNQCVASHGWSHTPHVNGKAWQKSVLETQQLLQDNIKPFYSPFFRPPYGQREADSDAFFYQHNINVILWNIDSQDWRESMEGKQAGDRVVTLMLLWRKGIILFHDVHAKAQIAVPIILDSTEQANIHWLNCRLL